MWLPFPILISSSSASSILLLISMILIKAYSSIVQSLIIGQSDDRMMKLDIQPGGVSRILEENCKILQWQGRGPLVEQR